MNSFVYNEQIKREKWLIPQIVYLTPQIHAWAVMLTPNFPALFRALVFVFVKSHIAIVMAPNLKKLLANQISSMIMLVQCSENAIDQF